MDTVIFLCSNRCKSAVEVDIQIAVDTVVAGSYRVFTAVDVDAVLGNDAFSCGIHLDGRDAYAVGNHHIVEGLNAVVTSLGDVDCSALDAYDALAFGNSGIVFVYGAFVTLDAVAGSGSDGDVSFFNIYEALALDAVVLGGDIDGGFATETEIVGTLDAVIVVAGHVQCAGSLEGHVVLGVDGGVRGVGLGDAAAVDEGVSLGAGASVA